MTKESGKAWALKGIRTCRNVCVCLTSSHACIGFVQFEAELEVLANHLCAVGPPGSFSGCEPLFLSVLIVFGDFLQ